MANTNSVQINVKALVEFNISLLAFNAKLNDSLSEIKSSITILERSWHDEKFNEFKVSFLSHAKDLEPLAHELKRYKEHSEKVWIPIITQYLKDNTEK